MLKPLDVVEGRNWLAFGGVEAPSFPVFSAEQQFAEKLHAYSLPRGERANTRTKDLIGASDPAGEARQIQSEEPPPRSGTSFRSTGSRMHLDVSLSDGFEIARGFVAKIRER